MCPCWDNQLSNCEYLNISAQREKNKITREEFHNVSIIVSMTTTAFYFIFLGIHRAFVYGWQRLRVNKGNYTDLGPQGYIFPWRQHG